MSDNQYEVFERFSIISVEENDVIALKIIKEEYGINASNWVARYILGKRK